MNDIDVAANGQGWVVGHNMYPDKGFIFHYDGEEWRNVTPGEIPPLYCVDAVAADDVWAAGWYGTAYHYDGVSWKEARFPSSPEINDLHFVSSDNGWAVGYDGLCLHYDGSTWLPGGTNDWEDRDGVYFPTADEGWVVGGGAAPEIPAYKPILHYENGAWHDERIKSTIFSAVHFAAPNDGWAVGQAIYRYDGTKWTEVPRPGNLVALDVFTLGGDDVWLACTKGYICKYNPNKE